MSKSFVANVYQYFKIILPIKKINAEKYEEETYPAIQSQCTQITEPSFYASTHGLSLLSLSVCECITAAVKIVTPESVTNCFGALAQSD